MLKTAGNFYLYYKIGSMYLISIIFIVVSIFAYRFIKNDVHTAETRASLNDTKCDANDCSAIANYTVDGNTYDTPVYYSLKDGGSRNKVYYDPENPKDAVLSKFPLVFAYILSGLAVCLLMAAIGLTVFATYANNNAKATMGGIFAASNTISALTSHR